MARTRTARAYHAGTERALGRALSDALDDGRDAHAAADAQRDQRVGLVRPLQLVERSAERDRAAVHVDALGIDAERARRLQRHHGERLVDLPQIDVADGHAGLLERL